MLRTIFLAAALAAVVIAPARSQGLKQLTVLVDSTPGSTYDFYGRAVGKYMARHLAGQPTLVVQNMPGAGGLNATNYLYNISPKDGSTIAVISRGLPVQPLLDPAGVRFDALKMNWIGSPADEVSVVFSWHTKPFKTVEDMRERQMIIPATGTGADSITFPYVLNGVLGTKFKIVAGYPGGSELQLAVERGEADGIASTSWSNLKASRMDWIRDKKINIILQMGLRKHPDLPDVPFVMDYAKTDSDRQVLELVFSRQAMAWPFAAPPGVAPERVQELRDAFDAAMKDAEFAAEVGKIHLEVRPITGAEIEALLNRIYHGPPEIIARTKAVLEAGKAVTSRK
jgi:tripartite-type tricarboxylate transporter receptor subunit TctC